MTDKMKNLLVRSLSGAVLAAVIIGAIVWSPWSLSALLLLLTAGGMHEFYALAEKRGTRPQRIAGMVVGLVFCLLHCSNLLGEGFGMRAFFGGILLFVLAVPVMLICELYRKNADPLAAVGATSLGVCYVALPLTCLCYVYEWGGGYGMLLCYIFIIWANDVCAYLVGMTLGRHPLFPRLSPKKSWEGFAGGIAGAMAVGFAAACWRGESTAYWLGLAAIASATGVLGDLAESMFKRAADVKDSGHLIPGHGGVLDRFDAVLLSAPFVAAYMFFHLFSF